MGCQFNDKCREDCNECTEEMRVEKLAKLIDEARDRAKEEALRT